jgi:hypothetical protein
VSSYIRDALQALSRNAEHVEAVALGGTVQQDAIPKPAVAALRGASALRAAGEDSWRLHPRLREYLQDHLQVFPAYQSLTEIGYRLNALRALMQEAHHAVRERDHESLHGQLEEMSTQIFDIYEMTERNLRFLGKLMSIKYGAVRSLTAKTAQNRWYQRQAGVLADDLNRLGRLSVELEQEADARGWAIARQLRRSIIDRMPQWQLRLSDIQSQLRQEIFRLYQVQQDLRNLARADAFLSQNPSWQGLEIDLPDRVPAALLKASMLAIAAYVDPQDDAADMRRDLAQLAQTVPLRKTHKTVEAPKRLRPVEDLNEEPPQPDPYLLLLRRFAAEVAASSESLSILGWAARHPAGAILRPPAPTAVRPSVWLMFAVCALDGRTHRIEGRPLSFVVEEVTNAPEPGCAFAHTFRDALVRVAA